jgi:PAS domain S-box-containing protein
LIQPLERTPRGGPAGWLRVLWPRESPGRWSTLLVVALWIYAAGLSGWLARQWLSGFTGAVPAWTLMLPPQAITALVLWRLLGGPHRAGARGLGWWFLLGATVVDTLAIVDWSYVVTATGQPFGTWVDALYMLNYALLAAGAGAFFVSCGGSFLRTRVWVDAATLIFGAVAALLPFLFTPLFDPVAAFHASALATLGYAIGIAVTATAALLLFMQVMDWQRDRAMTLVMLGIATIIATDVLSVAGNVRGHFEFGNLDDLGYCWSYVLIASAALVEQRRGEPAERVAGAEGNVYSFLPVLAILLCIVIVLGLETRHADFSLLTAAVLLSVSAVLLVVRQLGVRHQLRQLNAALAVQAADARLTELVRRSADLILVVTPAGAVSYASPAANEVLGRAPESMIGLPATAMLGAVNAARMSALLNEIQRADGESVELELAVEAGIRPPLVVHVIGSSESRNPLINGTVLTVRDVTAQRATEREVLEVASRERHRLAGEVHEGIGQDLAGIALMLKSLAIGAETDARPVRDALGPIVEEVNRTVRSVRALARGLSPLGVVRGSLMTALQSLVADVEERQRIQVRLRCAATPAEGTPAAEHLYYIAHEAISRAMHRRQCSRIDVELHSAGAGTVLTVSDDALGDSADETAADELPHRLMRYRARLIGATVRITRRADAGSRVEVTVPSNAPPSR